MQVFRFFTKYLFETPFTVTNLNLLRNDATIFANLGFVDFCHSSLQVLCYVRWCFSVSPGMFIWIQVRALLGPLKDIHRVVQKPLLS